MIKILVKDWCIFSVFNTFLDIFISYFAFSFVSPTSKSDVSNISAVQWRSKALKFQHHRNEAPKCFTHLAVVKCWSRSSYSNAYFNIEILVSSLGILKINVSWAVSNHSKGSKPQDPISWAFLKYSLILSIFAHSFVSNKIFANISHCHRLTHRLALLVFKESTIKR